MDLLIKYDIYGKNIYLTYYDTKYDFGKYIIEPVYAPHDCLNCGYKITIKKNNYKIFHITDVGNLDHIEAKNYDFYGLESNYDDEELKARKEEKLENGEFAYEQRVEFTHLSRQQFNEFILQNASETSIIVPLHQHIEKEKKYEA